MNYNRKMKGETKRFSFSCTFTLRRIHPLTSSFHKLFLNLFLRCVYATIETGLESIIQIKVLNLKL